MKIDTQAFTSKVSRRAFLLFVACALLPITILALISLRQVTTELRGQSERRLRQASKAVGLLLHRRLLAADAALGDAASKPPSRADESVEHPFLGVSAVDEGGHRRILWGRVGEAPSTSPDQMDFLRQGRSVLLTDARENGHARFFLTRAVDREDFAKGILLAEIDPDYLWVVQDEAALEPGARLFVFDDEGKLLISTEDSASIPVQLRARAQNGTAGQFLWKDGKQEFLASAWILFVKNQFHAKNWNVIISRETDDVFAPIGDFKRNFLLVALLSLLVVVLLSFGQIRKILLPLARLQDATQRLALGRLDTRVVVESRDEFQDLAESFNRMTAQLSRQFDALAMRSEITISLSRNESVGTILQRCVEILVRSLNLSSGGVWILQPEGKIYSRVAVAGGPQVLQAIPQSLENGQGELARVLAEARPLALNLPAGDNRWMQPEWSRQQGIVAFVGHPLFVDGRLQAVLAVYAAHPLDVIDLGGLAAAAAEISQGIARQRVAEALRESEVQVRQLQKMEAVGRLAGGVAHDFNNLLTVIMGYTQMVIEGLEATDVRREHAEVVEKTAMRAAQLTKQLLAFSRKQVLAPKLHNLNTLIKAMISMLQRLIGEDIELVLTLQDQLGLVKIDRGQFEQVIVNLVVNARDAMPKGGRITLEAAAVELSAQEAQLHAGASAGPHVRLKVIDTGTGMDATTLGRIFEPFFTTKEPGKGTGLGLATVYGIIAQSGASIRVDSEVGVGTTFTFHFPSVSGTEEVAPQTSTPRPRGHETVLLVEDENEVRSLVQQILTGQGYRVLSAGRPSDALRQAENFSKPIHLLLTDMVMPEMSGAALSQQIQVLHPETVVLQMSGYTEYRGNGAEAEEIAFLQKPFTPETLAREVRAVLDRSPRAPRAVSS